MSTTDIMKDGILCCEAAEDPRTINLKSLIYAFTTESISGYINEFDLENKSLLTVGSSGDQVINAILCNCKDITLFDTLPEAKYYCYLKCAGLLSLSKDEFLEFFRYRYYNQSGNDNSNVFNFKSYNKLKSALRILDYEAYLYFDELFNTFSGITIRKALFNYDEDETYILEKSNLYLKNNILYDETSKKIKKVKPKFICQDIFNIDNSHTYDNIWLSNIATWLITEKEILELVNKTYECLNENGKLLVSYLYKTNSKSNFSLGFAPVYNLKKIKEMLNSYKLELKEFDGVASNGWITAEKKDSVLIITK